MPALTTGGGKTSRTAYRRKSSSGSHLVLTKTHSPALGKWRERGGSTIGQCGQENKWGSHPCPEPGEMLANLFQKKKGETGAKARKHTQGRTLRKRVAPSSDGGKKEHLYQRKKGGMEKNYAEVAKTQIGEFTRCLCWCP